jgi:nicotinamidase-related amidase
MTNLTQSKENTMTNQIHPYKPLTSQNAALVLVDHQVGLMTGVRDYSTGELKHNVVALAKAAKALKLPIVAMPRMLRPNRRRLPSPIRISNRQVK